MYVAPRRLDGLGSLERVGVLGAALAVLLVRLLAVDGGVETLAEMGRGGKYRHDEVDRLDEAEGHDEGVDGAEAGAPELLKELLAAGVGAVGVHAVIGEDADEEGAEVAAHTVHGEHVEGVVEVELVLDNLDEEVAPGGGEAADDHRGPGVHVTGGGGDGGETGDGADAGTDEGGLALVRPLDHEPHEESAGRGDLGVDEGVARNLVGAEGGAAVEAEPAEPEEGGAESDEGDVVGVGVELGLELLAVGKGHDDGEGAETGGAVHDDAAGEVPNSLIHHPAAAPNPVAEGVVDEVDPEEDEEKVGLEHDAIGEGTGHERGGDDGEHALEGCESRREGRKKSQHFSKVSGDQSGFLSSSLVPPALSLGPRGEFRVAGTPG